MCGLYPGGSQLTRFLDANEPRLIDIGKITCQDKQGGKVIRHFINACSLGMGPDVVRRLAKSNRSLGPALTYWKAITATFFSHRPQEIHCRTAAWEWRGKIRVLAIANGQSFGNSIYIAPDALPDDGLLNTFIAGDLPLWKFLFYQQTLKRRNKISDPSITYNQATQIELTSAYPCGIEAEGEFVGHLPASVEIMPSAIGFLR
jgi:diacylglycerol kinase family enzyme